jgi:hypothetical protein
MKLLGRKRELGFFLSKRERERSKKLVGEFGE